MTAYLIIVGLLILSFILANPLVAAIALAGGTVIFFGFWGMVRLLGIDRANQPVRPPSYSRERRTGPPPA